MQWIRHIHTGCVYRSDLVSIPAKDISPLFAMFQRDEGEYLRRVDHVLSRILPSPLLGAVSVSNGEYVSWSHCVTVGGLSLIHSLKTHLPAKNSLSHPKLDLPTNYVFEAFSVRILYPINGLHCTKTLN